MIKSLVGRIAGKASAPKESSPPPQNSSKPPRSEPSHKAADEGGRGPAKQAKGAGRRQRQRGKQKAPSAPWSIDDFKVDPKEGEVRFHDLDLREELMRGIADLGFKYCSPIQGAVLPQGPKTWALFQPLSL